LSKGDAVELKIEKLIHGGDGLARIPDGRAAFVPLTLPGELVQARVTEERRGFVRAEADQIVTPSPNRIAPKCPYFATCGGCQLQHGSYEAQVAAKLEILRETLQRVGGITAPPPVTAITADPWSYRNRIRLHVAGGRIGYLERRSHKLLPVEECPIAAPVLQTALRVFQMPESSALMPANVSEIELFTNHDESAVIVNVLSSAPINEAAFSLWMDSAHKYVPQLVGARLDQAGPNPASARPLQWRAKSLHYDVAGIPLQVTAGSFFQINRFLIDRLIKLVADIVQPRAEQTIWDLYAGVGLFATALAARGAEVTPIESARPSHADLVANMAPISQRVPPRISSEEFLHAQHRSAAPDAIIVDPPRAGLGGDVVRALTAKRAPLLLYLSCDPATLSRDLRALLESGYRFEQAHLIDLFPQTFHIEALAVLRR
jgi:23S rRNA (uracil1939-C5)-methyltransferase